MDISVVTQLVGSLGFPIVCCGYMMVCMNKTIKENTLVTQRMSNLLDRLCERFDIHENNNAGNDEN